MKHRGKPGIAYFDTVPYVPFPAHLPRTIGLLDATIDNKERSVISGPDRDGLYVRVEEGASRRRIRPERITTFRKMVAGKA